MARAAPQSGKDEGVGFNPFRPHRTSTADYVFVAAGILVVVMLVLWAAGAL